MQSEISLILSVFLAISFSTCSVKEKPSIAPQFIDNGKTIDSIKMEYSAENIEFENWEEDDSFDSSLTICLVNSKGLFSKGIDPKVQEFKSIASRIRNSLANKTKYKTYYIIFVKSEKSGFSSTRLHTAGMDIPVGQL